jgi:hypothetical protein
MKTIKTKVVALVMAVAMVFAIGMTAFAASTTRVDDVKVNDVYYAGDGIYNNHSRTSYTINNQTLRAGSTYYIPDGYRGTVTAFRNRAITIDLVPDVGPTPAATIDYDRITVGATLNAGDSILNSNHRSGVKITVTEGGSSSLVTVAEGNSYVVPDGMTALVTDKSSNMGNRLLSITLIPVGEDGEHLTPEQLRALSINAFVENMYIDTLGRSFDIEGRANFTAALNGNEMTGSDVVRAMFNSEEYAARNQTDEEFIATLCQVMAHRAPTDAEIATWTTALASGTTRAQVVDAFLATEEFASVCAFFQVNV